MFRSLVFLFLAFCSFRGSGQSLYMPRDVKQAFAKGTRSPDGRPGKNYWQNKARYQIAITVTPPSRVIQGEEDIVYFNKSPDTLSSASFKLFMNIHKPGALRADNATADYLSAGMKIDAFRLNGQSQEWPDPDGFVLQSVPLPSPLLPGDSIRFSFRWHYELASLDGGREGAIDSTTFFLAYFYPRVVVYDDYNGWDKTNFTDLQEFYSDFNDYTVTLRVPANYIVWGTGTLQEPGSVLQPDIAERLKASQASDALVHIVNGADLRAKNVTLQNRVNSWRFTATDIPDMAYAVSDHFVWDASSMIVDRTTGRRSSIHAVYNDTASDYHQMVRYARKALDWLSNQWPGVPYPYEKMTVFQGNAGMEYPMVANDESYGDTLISKLVATHEIAHTWMPFYMGINETRYGFMDEGWATTFELLFSRHDFGVRQAEQLFKDFRVHTWQSDPGAEEDIPIITPGHALTGIANRTNNYGKAALGYLAMKDYLGDELFKKCLHEYMRRWHGKHPIPWDFFNTFNDVSGRNLNWFWNSWFFSWSYMDIAVQKLISNGKGYTLTVKNVGGMPVPFDCKVLYTDGSHGSLHQSPAVWQVNPHQATVHIPTGKKIASLTIDGGIWMDSNPADNEWPSTPKK